VRAQQCTHGGRSTQHTTSRACERPPAGQCAGRTSSTTSTCGHTARVGHRASVRTREVVLSTQSHQVQQQSACRWRTTQTKEKGAMEHCEKSCPAYLRLQVGQEQRQSQHRPREPPGPSRRGPGPARGRSGRHVNAPGTARGHTPQACGNASQHLVVVCVWEGVGVGGGGAVSPPRALQGRVHNSS
jgi:hypothetical protein